VKDERTINRRFLLKLTGYAVAAGALGMGALPAAAQTPTAGESDVSPAPGPPMQPPGTYQVSGRVRLLEPMVEISGITNAQQISWSPGSLSLPVAHFTSFEQFDQPWQMPQIRVRGGRLEALEVQPLDFA
jgi:hypothetical protein